MTDPCAILVDGDNVSAKHAATILAIGQNQGDPIIVRTYLDVRKISDWHGTIGYRLVHAGCGKNATDVLLAIEAMDFAHGQGIRSFVIATSDGDFMHLAIRLRELGSKVTRGGRGEGATVVPGQLFLFRRTDRWQACRPDLISADNKGRQPRHRPRPKNPRHDRTTQQEGHRYAHHRLGA